MTFPPGGIFPPGLQPTPLVGVEASDRSNPGVSGDNTIAQGIDRGSGVQGTSASFGVTGRVRPLAGQGQQTLPIVPAGVWGEGGANGDGVFGNSVNHDGVVGDSINADGVVGISHVPLRSGIVGRNTNSGGLAGFFEGNVTITVHFTPGDMTCNGNITSNGNMTCHGNINMASGQDIILGDCAEEFDARQGTSIEPGLVMVIDQDGAVEPSCRAYDKRVAGVISGAGNCRPAIVLDKQLSHGHRVPLALLGKVYCKVDATYASIEVGDLLTTSATLGHAMKACDPMKGFGAVIGKALRSLESGQGMIPILIALQ